MPTLILQQKGTSMSQPPLLSVRGRKLALAQVQLDFARRRGITDVFAQYESKTLGQTLQKKRYRGLMGEVRQGYDSEMDVLLGPLLMHLKRRGDDFYKRFLNHWGDEEYCEFSIQGDLADKKGLYCFTVDGEVKYIGRSHDPFEERVNKGYGIIHPKNCYLDGQATNCHVNSLIAAETGEVEFWVCPLACDREIDDFERVLIDDRRPAWNSALRGQEQGTARPRIQATPMFAVGLAAGVLTSLALARGLLCRR